MISQVHVDCKTALSMDGHQRRILMLVYLYVILIKLNRPSLQMKVVRSFTGVNFTSMDRDQRNFILFLWVFNCLIVELIPNFCGSDSPSQILSLNCDQMTFEARSPLPFHSTSAACSTNDDHIMLCFSKENKKRCYRSRSPTPEHWWQFTLTRMSNFEHNFTAISLSSYYTSGIL